MPAAEAARTAAYPSAFPLAPCRKAIPTLASAVLIGVVLLTLWPVETVDDRTTSLLAGAAFLLCGLGCWRGLGLHPLSPAMVYLYVFGVFHLGLVVPWGLGLDIGVPPSWLRDSSLGSALLLVVAALSSYLAGAALAVSKWPSNPRRETLGPYHNRVLALSGAAVFLAGCGMFLWGAWTIGFEPAFSI